MMRSVCIRLLSGVLPITVLGAWAVVLVGVSVFPGYVLAYESHRQGNVDIYLLDVLTRIEYNLTQHPADDRHPAWSPDGRYIAFESNRFGRRGIFVMDVWDGTFVQRVIPEDWYGIHPAWSTDGRRIVFSRQLASLWHAIFEVRLQDGAVRMLVQRDGHSFYDPVWSPDGETLLFSGVPSGLQGSWRIYTTPFTEWGLMQVIPVRPKPLTELDGVHPTWLPDGSHALFVRQRTIPMLHLIHPNNGSFPIERNIHVEHPHVSPDGQWIAFGSYAGNINSRAIYRMRPDGSELQVLSPRRLEAYPFDNEPAWMP